MSDRLRDDARSLVGRLYESYGPALYRYAVLLVTDPAAAEDVVQQVFAKVLRRRAGVDNEEHYLRRAVRNECYSLLRGHQRQRGWIAAAPFIEPLVEGVPQEERMALERALRELSPEQREVIHLHVFEGWTFQEIASAAEVSINTVAGRYRYALAKLREVLTRAP